MKLNEKEILNKLKVLYGIVNGGTDKSVHYLKDFSKLRYRDIVALRQEGILIRSGWSYHHKWDWVGNKPNIDLARHILELSLPPNAPFNKVRPTATSYPSICARISKKYTVTKTNNVTVTISAEAILEDTSELYQIKTGKVFFPNMTTPQIRAYGSALLHMADLIENDLNQKA